MYTRGDVQHAYGPYQARYTTSDGAIKVSRSGDVPQMWPIARPVTSWNADSAYYQGTMYTPGNLVRTGIVPFTPSQPNIEMDPSDPATWQRDYRFSNGR
jgi:hypothetical protein